LLKPNGRQCQSIDHRNWHAWHTRLPARQQAFRTGDAPLGHRQRSEEVAGSLYFKAALSNEPDQFGPVVARHVVIDVVVLGPERHESRNGCDEETSRPQSAGELSHDGSWVLDVLKYVKREHEPIARLLAGRAKHEVAGDPRPPRPGRVEEGEFRLDPERIAELLKGVKEEPVPAAEIQHGPGGQSAQLTSQRPDEELLTRSPPPMAAVQLGVGGPILWIHQNGGAPMMRSTR
jgi:hypothetical protein